MSGNSAVTGRQPASTGWASTSCSYIDYRRNICTKMIISVCSWLDCKLMIHLEINIKLQCCKDIIVCPKEECISREVIGHANTYSHKLTYFPHIVS